MTLVLVASNDQQVIQVSDRRLTGLAGPDVLPRNKALIIHLADGRLVMGFTGLARAGTFRTGEWMIDAFAEAAAQAGRTMAASIERFREIATEEFARSKRLQAVADRRLTFILTGFLDQLPHPVQVAAAVTNFEHFDGSPANAAPDAAFRANYWLEEPVDGEVAPTWLEAVGARNALDLADIRGLKDMLVGRVAAEEIRDRMVEIIRAASDRPTAAGTVGRDLSSITLFRHQRAPLAGYHPAQAADIWFGVSALDIASDQGHTMVRDVQFRPDAFPGYPPILPPERHHEACPCASGLPYKECCGGPPAVRP